MFFLQDRLFVWHICRHAHIMNNFGSNLRHIYQLAYVALDAKRTSWNNRINPIGNGTLKSIDVHGRTYFNELSILKNVAKAKVL